MSNENREPADERPPHAMTDDTHDELEQVESDEEEPERSDRRIDGDLRRKLNYALLLGLGLLALIAVIQFYLNISSVIDQWVTREYRSLFQATFNLVVLLVVGAAISRQVRRLAD